MSKLAPDKRINSEIKTSLFASIPQFRIFGQWPTLGGKGGWGCRAAPRKAEFKNTDFVDTMISKVLRDLRFSLNHPLKSPEH
jgi:hypothetical protein